jgi:hypothetical protein
VITSATEASHLTGVCYDPRRMMRRRLVVTLLIGLLMTLTPLAHAEPPDQTWIAGLYDDADYDDVALSVTSGTGLVECRPPNDSGLILTALGAVQPHDESRPAKLAPSSNSARAPPAA